MIWNFCHTCPSSACFSSNTYPYWKVLLLRGNEQTVHSKDFFTQGYPITLLMYDIGVILLIIAITRHFQNSEGQMKRYKIQVLYADNPALADSFS